MQNGSVDHSSDDLGGGNDVRGGINDVDVDGGSFVSGIDVVTFDVVMVLELIIRVVVRVVVVLLYWGRGGMFFTKN